MRVWKLVASFIGVAIISILLYKYFIGFCSRLSTYVTYPSLVAYHKGISPLKEKVDAWQEKEPDIQEVLLEKKKLRIECERLQAENIKLQALLTYQKDIRELDSFRQRCFNDKGTIIQILATIITPQEHSIIIHAGSRDSVEKDMIAVYKNFLVGRVIEVNSFYSKVALVTDKKCSVAGYCFKTKASGIYSGANDVDKAHLKYVNHISQIKQGDQVISSGKGLVYPQGLGLGTVKSSRINGVHHEVEVAPLFDIENLEYCLLMKK